MTDSAMELLISPQLIEEFNRATALVRKGDLEGALAVWDELLSYGSRSEKRAPPGGGQVCLTGEFLAQVTMRKAWVLMDLGRHEEALEALSSALMEACLSELSPEDLYEYHFSRANTLGALGRVELMHEQFDAALNLAARQLGDMDRCCQCWSNLMRHAENSEAWDDLEQQSRRALRFARNNGAEVLDFEARFRHVLALAGLQRGEEMEQEARSLLTEARRLGVTVAVERLEMLLK